MSLFVNVENEAETKNCASGSFSNNFSHWLSKKNLKKTQVRYFTVGPSESLLGHANIDDVIMI